MSTLHNVTWLAGELAQDTSLAMDDAVECAAAVWTIMALDVRMSFEEAIADAMRYRIVRRPQGWRTVARNDVPAIAHRIASTWALAKDLGALREMYGKTWGNKYG